MEDLTAYIPFLARDDTYLEEKPYGADFSVDGKRGAKMTNHIYDIRSVKVHDVRAAKEPPQLASHGFCYIKNKTSLKAEDATIKATPAMQRYIKEVMAIVQEHFQDYVEIRYMDFQIRKRSRAFPNGHGKQVEYAQPATMPHTDFSVAGAFMRMQDVFPEHELSYQNRSFDLINVWRVLNGPNDDWPLAVCDFSSIDVDKDTTTNDAIHLTRTGENWLLYPNENYRWYYKSAMQNDDLVVFRNTDSEGRLSRCFHAAFDNPNANCEPRHSVEVRLVAFRN